MILGLFFATLAFAQLCVDFTLPTVKEVPVTEGLGYFMRAADDHSVGFTSGKGNRLLNLKNGTFTAVPGKYDPVLAPDGEVLATPVSETADGRDELHMQFFRRGAGGLTRIYNDTKVTATYQSLGITSKNPGETHYRMLYQDGNEISVKDYTYDRAGGQLRPDGESRPVCGNGLQDVSLPVLSKDGREFAYYDFVKRITFIYEVGKPGEPCRQKDEIPALVGKLDFSFDGSQILFHADSEADESFQFEHPDAAAGLGVYLYDRTTKAIRPLHVAKAENAYYPVFLNERELAYVVSPRDGRGDHFAIRTAALPAPGGASCKSCLLKEPERTYAGILGHFYHRACRGQGEFRLKAGLNAFFSLSTARCLELLSTLKKEDLQKLRDGYFKEMPERVPDDLAEYRKVCAKIDRAPEPPRKGTPATPGGASAR